MRLWMAVLLSVWLTPALAQDDALDQAKKLFQRYMSLDAAQDEGLAQLYADSALIQVKTRSSMGQGKVTTVPLEAHRSALQQRMQQARAQGITRNYEAITYAPVGERVRVSAMVEDEPTQIQTVLLLLLGRDANGRWLIEQEVIEPL